MAGFGIRKREIRGLGHNASAVVGIHESSESYTIQLKEG